MGLMVLFFCVSLGVWGSKEFTYTQKRLLVVMSIRNLYSPMPISRKTKAVYKKKKKNNNILNQVTSRHYWQRLQEGSTKQTQKFTKIQNQGQCFQRFVLELPQAQLGAGQLGLCAWHSCSEAAGIECHSRKVSKATWCSDTQSLVH